MKTIFVPMMLRCARKRHEMTLKHVSENTGITISQLSEIERGVTLPSIKTMLTLTDFYDVPVESLFSTFEDIEW